MRRILSVPLLLMSAGSFSVSAWAQSMSLEEGAKRGDEAAIGAIEIMFCEGMEGPYDDEEAVRMCSLAAEQGSAVAQTFLGFAYANGRGVQQNYRQAVRWHRLAAEQGFARAQITLGALYASGKGVPQNYVAAYLWFNLAAAQGEPRAATARDAVAKSLSPSDLGRAQRLSSQCEKQAYKNCDF